MPEYDSHDPYHYLRTTADMSPAELARLFPTTPVAPCPWHADDEPTSWEDIAHRRQEG